MKSLNLVAAALITLGTIAGCTPNISPDVDQAGNANQVSNTVKGTIVAVRPIKVKGDADNKVGALAGAVAGGAGGSAIGGGDRMHIIGAVGGALLGGLAGNMAQDKLSTQTGYEYIVKLTNGQLKTVVQSGGNAYLSVGQKVYVIMGQHARVIPA